MRPQFVAVLLVCVCALFPPCASAAPVQVKYKEGVTHGFLVLTTEEGTAIAYGDSTEVVHGNNVTAHLSIVPTAARLCIGSIRPA